MFVVHSKRNSVEERENNFLLTIHSCSILNAILIYYCPTGIDLIFSFSQCVFSLSVCMAGYNEKRLLHDLLDSYNILERPVVNESDPLQLSFGLTLMQIIDVVSSLT